MDIRTVTIDGTTGTMGARISALLLLLSETRELLYRIWH